MSSQEQHALDWLGDAVCNGYPNAADHFFPTRGESNDVAVALCARCPVAGPCLEYALDTHQDYGVWAGTSPGERRRLRRTRGHDTPDAGRCHYCGYAGACTLDCPDQEPTP